MIGDDGIRRNFIFVGHDVCYEENYSLTLTVNCRLYMIVDKPKPKQVEVDTTPYYRKYEKRKRV